MLEAVEIAGRQIGGSHPVYIVAEISANHHQDLDLAMALVRAASEAGADAIKLQTYTPDTLTIRSQEKWFRISGTVWEGKTLHELYAEAFTPWEWHEPLKAAAEGLGLTLFSSAFDPSSVEFLEALDIPAYKVASFELVDLPLIERIAGTGKPLVMSTGMATLAEIDEAVRTARGAGATQVVLLKCTSAYPAPPEDICLKTIPHLSATFGLPVGLSDHTLGVSVPVAAVALGASVIEKHITLSRSLPGPDAEFSLEPDEFATMVSAVRTAEKALGSIHYGPSQNEADTRLLRRSLFAVADIPAGETFTHQNVRSIRPGQGLAPKYLPQIIGRRAALDISRGTPLDWPLVS